MASPAMLSPQQLEPVAFPPSSHESEVAMAASVPVVEAKAEMPRYRQTRFVEVGLVDGPVET